jgi:predicted CopG family antitoxin
MLVPLATTIQVEDERRARLARLKVGGMTYDDVIDQLLRGVDEEEFRRLALQWQDDLARRVRAKPGNRRLL